MLGPSASRARRPSPGEAHGARFWGSQPHGVPRGSLSVFSFWLQRESPGRAFKSFSSCDTLLIFSLRLVTEGDRIYNEHAYPHINDQLNSCPSCFIYTLHNSPYIVLNQAKKVVFSFPFFFFSKYKS